MKQVGKVVAGVLAVLKMERTANERLRPAGGRADAAQPRRQL
jgi:hypothetical protein